MKNCYEKLFDLIENNDYKIAFEASGITIDEMAKQAPEVLAKLRKLVSEGKIEPVASPYIHFMLSFDKIRKATGLEFDVQGHSNKNHLFKIEEYIKDKPQFLKYITNPSVAPQRT